MSGYFETIRSPVPNPRSLHCVTPRSRLYKINSSFPLRQRTRPDSNINIFATDACRVPHATHGRSSLLPRWRRRGKSSPRRSKGTKGSVGDIYKGDRFKSRPVSTGVPRCAPLGEIRKYRQLGELFMSEIPARDYSATSAWHRRDWESYPSRTFRSGNTMRRHRGDKSCPSRLASGNSADTSK